MIASRGLRFQHLGGPQLAFPDVDLPQGGILLLQGPSGSGKSTWLALVAALRRATAGSLVVAGQALQDLGRSASDRWRGRTVGYLPQRLHLSEALSVERNLALAFYAVGARADGAAIASALEALGLQGLAQRRPRELSGGQAQRVALARALLLQPRVLLADEPTASLDDQAAAAALQALREGAARAGATLVIATHDVRARAACADAQVLALPPASGQAVAAAA